jgi:hypothetical protein
MKSVRRNLLDRRGEKNQILSTDLKMWRETLGVKLILKQSGTALRKENLAVSFVVTRLPAAGVGSSSFSKAKPPSFVTVESTLMVLSWVCAAAFNRDAIGRAVPERIPLVKNPGARNARLKNDKTDNVFFVRDMV